MGLIDNIKEYQHNFAVNSKKEKAYLSFLEQGFPNTKNEEWKFSSLKKIISNDFSIEDKGIEINTQISGEEISAPRLEPFWAKVEEMDIVVFIHTAGFSHPDRLKDHYFINLIGHPVEATLAISRLIFDGVLEAHPGLKIIVSHGGGYLPESIQKGEMERMGDDGWF